MYVMLLLDIHPNMKGFSGRGVFNPGGHFNIPYRLSRTRREGGGGPSSWAALSTMAMGAQ